MSHAPQQKMILWVFATESPRLTIEILRILWEISGVFLGLSGTRTQNFWGDSLGQGHRDSMVSHLKNPSLERNKEIHIAISTFKSLYGLSGLLWDCFYGQSMVFLRISYSPSGTLIFCPSRFFLGLLRRVLDTS